MGEFPRSRELVDARISSFPRFPSSFLFELLFTVSFTNAKNPGGMRVIWESKPRKFYTQTGGVLTPPAEFAKQLPRNVNLDGTLTW